MNASPPIIIAGPKLLAGFTDVPMIGIPTIWIKTNAKPIEIPANPFGTYALVDAKITKINIPTRTSSTIKQATREYPPGDNAP